MPERRLLLLSLGLGAVVDVLPSGSRIAFVPTAGDPYDDPYFVTDDRERLKKLGFEIVDVDFAAIDATRLRELLDQVDAVFVAGGNTFYLLEAIQQSHLADAIKEAVDAGLLYIGASAGAVVAGPTVEPVQAIDDASKAPLLDGWQGLGLVPFVVLPHYGKEKYLALYDRISDEFGNALDLRRLRDTEAIYVVSGNASERNSEMLLHDA